MTEFIPFALPDISESEVEAVARVLRSGWITTGPVTKDFEARFGEAVGGAHCVMVNSCTAALHLALEAVGVRRGDEVIVPAITFAATAEVVRYFDATPVIVDVHAHDHNIAPARIEAAIGPRTKAIIPVHFAGIPCDMDEITEIARARALPVIADSAHCFPGAYRGRPVGTLADVSCFSFYATKTITTAEGGAAVCNDSALADRMRLMSLHGISRDAWKRYHQDGSWYYEVLEAGFKYNMTDVAAALGVVQLGRATQMLERRRSIAQRYDQAFRDLPGVEVMPWPDDRTHSHHLYVLKLRLGELRCDRAQFISDLKTKGVGCSVHFIPLHLHPYYRDNFGYRPGAAPVAESVYERSVSLPIYSSMSDAAVDRVCEAVRDVARAALR
jgi:perosamine synthetase